MSRGRRGLTLAERSAAAGVLVPMGQARDGDGDGVDAEQRRRPVVSRHCWVSGLDGYPDRWAALLAG